MRPSFAVLTLILLTALHWMPSVAQPDDCSAALENRVKPATYGRVTLGGSANRVRNSPSTDAEIVFSLPPGHIFYVATFPVCTGSVLWLPIDVNGRTGWTAESAGGPDYFVEPMFGVQTLTDTLTLGIDANGLAFSADGRTLYTVNGTATLTTITLPDGGSSTRELSYIDSINTPLTGFFEDPAGRGYISLHQDSVVIWNVNFQQVRRVQPAIATEIESITVSPNGDWVAFSGCADNCTQAVVEVHHRETDEQIVLQPRGNRTAAAAFLLRQRSYTDLQEEAPLGYVISLTSDGEGQVWNLATGRLEFDMSNPMMARADAVVITVPELLIYGGCGNFDDRTCTAGKVVGYSWLSGGLRGVFSPLEGGEITEMVLSPTSTSRDRVFVLVEGAYVAALDFDAWGDDPSASVTRYDDVQPRSMTVSPAGDMLAVAATDEIWIYDTSVMTDPFGDQVWSVP